MEDLSIGTVVYLNSGSPALTVSDSKPGCDEIVVTWIDSHSDSFNAFRLPKTCVRITDPRA